MRAAHNSTPRHLPGQLQGRPRDPSSQECRLQPSQPEASEHNNRAPQAQRVHNSPGTAAAFPFRVASLLHNCEARCKRMHSGAFMFCSYAAVPCLTGLTCKDVAPQNSSPQYSDYRPKASRGPTKAFITDRSLPCNRLMPVTGGVGVAKAI